MAAGFFQDKHGKTVLTQPPNAPLIGWVVLAVVNLFVHSPKLGWLASAFLFTWAFIELYQGVNYFRRLLGLAVLVGIVLTHFRG